VTTLDRPKIPFGREVARIPAPRNEQDHHSRDALRVGGKIMRQSLRPVIVRMTGIALATFGLVCSPSYAGATVITFDAGVSASTPFTYTENGLSFALYGDAHFTDFAGGKALTIGTAADVIITPVGGGAFSLDSLLTLGPNYTGLFGWVHASDFHSGGNNNNGGGQGSAGPTADVSIDLSAINPTTVYPLLQDSRWGHIEVIDFCGYCVTSFGASGGIDNINFSVEARTVPESSTLVLCVAGLLGLVAMRRRQSAQTGPGLLL
jgi:hypothetical protein